MTEFNKNRRQRDGLQTRCRACQCRGERDFRQANPKNISEKNRRYWQANAEKNRERKHRYTERLRNQILNHYGRVCACPGCQATESLTIDHVNGGGCRHRIELFGTVQAGGRDFYLWLVRNNFPPGYQVLCMPCNASKGDGPACRLSHLRRTRKPWFSSCRIVTYGCGSTLIPSLQAQLRAC